MLKHLSVLFCTAGFTACVGNQTSHPAPAASAPARAAVSAPEPVSALRSGIDLQYVDRSVRPQDDVYEYLNGQWLRNYQLPADKAGVGSFTVVQDKTEEQLRTIVDGLDRAPGDEDVDAKKLADLYASYMNEAQLETLGIKPLLKEFAAIEAIKNAGAIPSLIAHLNQMGVG